MIKQVIAGLLVSSSVCFAQTAAPTTTSFVDNISICDTFTLTIKLENSQIVIRLCFSLFKV